MKKISLFLLILLTCGSLLAQNRYPNDSCYINMDTSRIVPVGRTDFLHEMSPAEQDAYMDSHDMDSLYRGADGVVFCKTLELPLLQIMDTIMAREISQTIKEYKRRVGMFRREKLDRPDYREDIDSLGIQVIDSSQFVLIRPYANRQGEVYYRIEPFQNVFMHWFLIRNKKSKNGKDGGTYGLFTIDGFLCVVDNEYGVCNEVFESKFYRLDRKMKVSIYRPEVEHGETFGSYWIYYEAGMRCD